MMPAVNRLTLYADTCNRIVGDHCRYRKNALISFKWREKFTRNVFYNLSEEIAGRMFVVVFYI